MTEQAFLDAIDAGPANPGPYLVLDDWLDERGDRRGELLRQLADVHQERGEVGPLRWRIHLAAVAHGGPWRRCRWRLSVAGHGRRRGEYSCLECWRAWVVARARARLARAVLSDWTTEALASLLAAPHPDTRIDRGQVLHYQFFPEKPKGDFIVRGILVTEAGPDDLAALIPPDGVRRPWPKTDKRRRG